MTWVPNKTGWGSEWVPGTLYPAYHIVTDGDWSMVSNKETSDRPAPQPIGSPSWESNLGTTPSWTAGNNSASVLVTGQRYNFTTDVWVTAARFWMPVAATDRIHEVWMVRNPSTSPAFQQLLGALQPTAGNSNQWTIISLGSIPIVSGSEVDFLLLVEATSGTPNSNSAIWSYKQDDGTPSEGEIWHQSNGYEMRVHYDDENDIPQTWLNDVTVGGTITAGGMIWTIYDIDSSPGWGVIYFVQPATRIGENDYLFQFSWESPITLDYVYITDHYSGANESHADIQGIIAIDGYDPFNVTLNENAYGIDLEIQDAAISDDWDFLAYSG